MDLNLLRDVAHSISTGFHVIAKGVGSEPLSAERMDSRSGPKRAVVSCYVNDLLSIDVVDSAFTPSLSFTLDWTDDGNVERSDDGGWQLKDGVDTDEVWRPFMDFENIVEKQDALDAKIRKAVKQHEKKGE